MCLSYVPFPIFAIFTNYNRYESSGIKTKHLKKWREALIDVIASSNKIALLITSHNFRDDSFVFPVIHIFMNRKKK